jgi:signal transduction histidine kinase
MSKTSTPQSDSSPPTSTASTQVVKLTGGQSVLSFFARYGTLLVLALMLIGFSIAKPEAFMTQNNLINILNQSALLAIVSAGLTFILVAGEFDLSFGNTVSLTGIFTVGLFARQDLPVWAAIAVALVMATLVGLLNGFLVTVLKVNSIVATLGVSTVVLGVNFWYSNGSPITVSDQGFVGIARHPDAGHHHARDLRDRLAALEPYAVRSPPAGSGLERDRIAPGRCERDEGHHGGFCDRRSVRGHRWCRAFGSNRQCASDRR